MTRKKKKSLGDVLRALKIKVKSNEDEMGAVIAQLEAFQKSIRQIIMIESAAAAEELSGHEKAEEELALLDIQAGTDL